MPTTVTVHMYSGVPNPTWELTEDQAQHLKDLFSQEREPTLKASSASLGLLGYRGIEVRSTSDIDLPQSALIFDGIIAGSLADQASFVDSNSALERFLIDTAGGNLDDEERAYISTEIAKNQGNGIGGSMSDVQILAVPPYNPGKWNNDALIRQNNNCYNYANDKITNTFAQPGRGSGQMYSALNCAEVGNAARRDGQISVGSVSSTPAQGHFIGLVIWPDRDYHWYRLDSNALWSHKPGQTAARNTDNSGRLIQDPQSCDRGPYTIWCGYYHCIPAQTRIR